MGTSRAARALRQAGRAGRKPRLTERHKARLEQRLLSGPERLGYDTSLWTSERVTDLIEQEFGVRYHPGHVWKILVSLGWSCQRPTGRALERNEEAIRHWKKGTWPDIKKSPKRAANDRFSRRKRAEPAAASLPDFVAAQKGRIHTEYLPAYAPELNPTEYIWVHCKHHKLPNACPKDFAELKHGACRALRNMRRRPTLITAFWKQAFLWRQ